MKRLPRRSCSSSDKRQEHRLHAFPVKGAVEELAAAYHRLAGGFIGIELGIEADAGQLQQLRLRVLEGHTQIVQAADGDELLCTLGVLPVALDQRHAAPDEPIGSGQIIGELVHLRQRRFPQALGPQILGLFREHRCSLLGGVTACLERLQLFLVGFRFLRCFGEMIAHVVEMRPERIDVARLGNEPAAAHAVAGTAGDGIVDTSAFGRMRAFL